MGLALYERQRNSGPALGPMMLALVVGALAGLGAPPARADNAFPTSQSVLLPRDRPNQIILGTTFGLVFSDDDGATWRYSCEDFRKTPNARRYIVGPPPDDRIYTVSDVGIRVSTDQACTWLVPGGDVIASMPTDVFPDPADVTRVFALSFNFTDALVAVYRSLDAGLTYAGPLFTPPVTATVTGIEVAASEPRTVFVTMFEITPREAPSHPRLVKSDDGGNTWATTDIEPGIGAVIPYLAEVDPIDSRRITLRVVSGARDPQQFQGLAITTDGGATWTTPLNVPGGTLSGYARLPDGKILAVGTIPSTMDGGTAVPAVFRSDDGQTFTTEPLAFHALGLAARAGILFVATNDFLDGFALASSSDGGRTWTPRLRFRDIGGPKDCVRMSCQDDCDYLAGVNLFPPEVCNPAVVPPATKKGGCGCGLAAGADPWAGIAIGAALLVAVGWVTRRRFPRVRR